MTESKVFTDNFSRSFTEPGDFFQFLSDRKARSKWMTAPSRELQFEPVERGSTLGNLYMQIYDHNGAAEILEDTMENTSLLLKVDGKDYPVRSCAIKTVLERARISGHALNKVSKTVFAEILNYCMGVASGDSLIKIADEKVSAVHGGDPKDYTVMEMLPLFKATSDFLNREYPGNTFMTAHFDHSIATAIWRLDGQADKLLDTYHREIAAKGLQTEKMVPALRFSTSDVGMSGANLYPIFLVGAESRIVPLGYSIRTEHKNGVDMQYFEEQLGLVYAQFEKALDKQVQLMNIEIRYPVTTLMRVLKRIKAPKKASYEAMDYFVAIHGDSPCTAYSYWSKIWVQQRIVPIDRQNIGEILRDNHLKEYDEYELLMLAMGRCAQDDYYLVPINEKELPEEITRRLSKRIEDVLPLENHCLLVFFRDGVVKKCDLQKHFEKTKTFQVLLKKPDYFQYVQMQTGGYGVAWDVNMTISDTMLYRIGKSVPLTMEDFRNFAAHRIINASEAAEILGCSRQNIIDLTKRGKLHPIKTSEKSTLYLKSEVLKRNWQ